VNEWVIRRLYWLLVDIVGAVRRKLRVVPSSVGVGTYLSRAAAAALTGTWLFANGCPVAGLMMGVAMLEKSRLRSASVGTVAY
jgi:hypothetical protein